MRFSRRGSTLGGAMLVGTLALLGCPPKEVSQTPPTGAASQPSGAASQPATAPAAGTSTTSMRGNDPSDRDQVDADGIVRRGAKLSEAKALTVSDCVAQADKLSGTTVKLEGLVDSVCAKKGCWFILKSNEDEKVRITFKDYAFFMPSNSRGHKATVEGELVVKTLDVATAQHYEDDRAKAAGETPKKVDGPVKEVTIAAVGVEMVKVEGEASPEG